LLVLVGVAVLCWVFPSGYGNLMIRLVAINLLVVCALNLLMGHGGQAFIAVAATFAIGAYASALGMMKLQLPWIVALAFGGSLAALFGLIASLPALRLSGAYLAMVSIAFNVIVEEVLVHWQSLTGGPVGLTGYPRGGPLGRDLSDAGMAMACCVVAACVWWWIDRLRRTPWGATIVAVRDSEVAARSLGIPTTRVKATTFLIATFLMGLGGALYAHSALYISPDMGGVFGSILFVLMLVLGGAGTRWGPVVGALILTLLPQLLLNLQKYHLFVLGLILLLCMIFMPRGIMAVDFARWRSKRSSQALPAADSAVDPAPAAEAPASTIHPSIPSDLLLEVHEVSLAFGGIQALSQVSVTIRPGQVHGLIGPNGAGKSSLVNVVTGHYAATAGRVTLNGQDLAGLGMQRIARLGIVRTFQTPQLFRSLSVQDNLIVAQFPAMRPSWWAGILGTSKSLQDYEASRARAQTLAARVGLGSLMDRVAGELSQGQQRLLEIARALASDPGVLILDEPAAGLSTAEIQELSDLLVRLKKTGLAIFLIEHHMEMVMEVCDVITVIDRGHLLLHGTPAQVQASDAVRQAYLGTFSQSTASAPST
jgi:branched-chain amino acid transport system ATP-binding protein/branched-chain amino acid transport system permease protein